MSRGLYVSALSLALLTAGCAVEKTSNPLSPSVAGPIPGVGITAPQMVLPSGGQRIAFDQQPVTLTIGNATTTGVRPLSYRFDLAADAGFTNILFSREGVEAGASGQTSLRLPEALPAERSYSWHARAEDGANIGAYSATAQFAVFTPLVLRAPVPVSPIDNVLVTTLRPTVVFQNAARTGPSGPIVYTIEASDSSAFTNSLTAAVDEQASQTSFTPPQDLPSSRQVFWRVRASASDPVTVGPWSTTQVFRTPAPAPVAPPPSTGGGGGSPSADDQLDLRTVTILKGAGSISSWPVGSRITRTSQGGGELCIWHEQLGKWPSVPFYGEVAVPVEGNQWVFANINGKWYGGAADWYRPGQACKGLDASSIGRDAFDQEPLHSWVPRTGELFGVMSTTPARAWPNMRTLDQRTNVVMMRWQ